MMAQNILVVPARRAGDFWIYWTGQTISLIGSALTSFALPLLVYKLSGSALDLGIATAAAWLPYLIFGPPIGTWVDRINRKGFMIDEHGHRARGAAGGAANVGARGAHTSVVDLRGALPQRDALHRL
jgi:MFS family permease